MIADVQPRQGRLGVSTEESPFETSGCAMREAVHFLDDYCTDPEPRACPRFVRLGPGRRYCSTAIPALAGVSPGERAPRLRLGLLATGRPELGLPTEASAPAGACGGGAGRRSAGTQARPVGLPSVRLPVRTLAPGSSRVGEVRQAGPGGKSENNPQIPRDPYGVARGAAFTGHFGLGTHPWLWTTP